MGQDEWVCQKCSRAIWYMYMNCQLSESLSCLIYLDGFKMHILFLLNKHFLSDAIALKLDLMVVQSLNPNMKVGKMSKSWILFSNPASHGQNCSVEAGSEGKRFHSYISATETSAFPFIQFLWNWWHPNRPSHQCQQVCQCTTHGISGIHWLSTQSSTGSFIQIIDHILW